MVETSNISIIATLAGEDRTISEDGSLPWRFAEDDKHFASLIKNQTVIIGRKAFAANVRDLSSARHRIILTRNISFHHEGATTAYSPEDALQKANQRPTREILVVGGGEVFETFIPIASRLYLTVIDRSIPGDTSFPECAGFEVTSEEEKKIGRTTLTFTELQRKRAT